MGSKRLASAKSVRSSVDVETFARLALIEREAMTRAGDTELVELRLRLAQYRAALDCVRRSIAVYDGDHRLVVCNPRFTELYRLTPDHVRPGTVLQEIVASRIAAGTWLADLVAAVSHLLAVQATEEAQSWIAKLEDGRSIHLHQGSMPNGWVDTHEERCNSVTDGARGKDLISLQTLIDQFPDYIWVKDVESRFIVANKAQAESVGQASTDAMLNLSDRDFYTKETAEEFRAGELQVIRTGEPMIDREVCLSETGLARKWLLMNKMPVKDQNGEVVGIVGISRDVTDRKQADLLREAQSRILEMIATNLPLNQVLDHLMLLVEAQLPGTACSTLFLDDDGLRLRHGSAPSLPADYTRAIDGATIGPEAGSCGTAIFRREPVVVSDIMTDPLWTDYREIAARFDLRSCWSTPILSHEGEVLGTFAIYSKTIRSPAAPEYNLVEIATHIAGVAIERKKAEDRIRFMAHHDPLTSLPNRNLLEHRLSEALLKAKADGRRVSTIFIDIDNFKYINDSLGHHAGDDLLRLLANRMRDCISDRDTIVRFGGDEFVILLVDQQDDADRISAWVQRIRARISERARISGRDLLVTASIGIATYPDDGTTAEMLIANADAAMYRAKDSGRDVFKFYTAEMNKRVHDRLQFQEYLRSAVARSQFMLHYQPQIDLKTNRIFAVEALIRWLHPTLGFVQPNDFIPLAEETGLIVPIGDWVLHEACHQAMAWQKAGLPPVTICVNVSARQFREPSLIARVIEALTATGLKPRHLELELTESMIMHNPALAIKTMEHLTRLGIKLSIDDFGTGYSSLSSLRTFPVSRLKIDKVFVRNLETNESDREVTSAVISLGQKLKMKVIAEGVETEGQLALLRDFQCDQVQGYYFSRPLPAEGIEPLLAGLR